MSGKTYNIDITNPFINQLVYRVLEKYYNYTDEFLKDDSMNFFMKDKGYIIDKSINDDRIVPLEVDWRKKNKVSSVKNQEKCGGCWAFSASEAVEGIWAIKNNVLYNLSQQVKDD